MTRFRAVLVSRFVLGMSSIGFVGLAILPVLYPDADSPGVPRLLFGLFALLATISSLGNIATDPLLFLFRHGFRGMYARGKDSRVTAESSVSRATKTIKVIDTYWGDVNNFRDAIEHALKRSASCKVQILLAKRDGCLAKVRDAAMPGEVEVVTSLQACIEQIEGLREQVNRTSTGAKERITVRFYDAIVMGPMIIVDDAHAIVGTFLQSGGSPITPAFEFKKRWLFSSSTIQQFVTTFDAIWHSASTDTDS